MVFKTVMKAVMKAVVEAVLKALLKHLDAALTRLFAATEIASTKSVGAIGDSIASTEPMKGTAEFCVSFNWSL